MHCPSKPSVRLILLPTIFLLQLHAVSAGSATWNLNPTTGNWNTAANWTPATIPNGPTNVATFDVSNTTSVSLTGSVVVSQIVFDSAASAFTITTPASNQSLTVSGPGIVNNSGIAQNFIVPELSTLIFSNSATVSPLTTVNNQNSPVTNQALTKFVGSATAGEGTFITNGSTSTAGEGSEILFLDNTSAANAHFINNGATPAGFAGLTLFFGSSTAANATFTNVGFSGFGEGGNTRFYENATADHATITNVFGGYVQFFGNSTAANSTITNNAGTTAGHAGVINFIEQSRAGNATIINPGGDSGSLLGGLTVFGGTSSADSATLVAKGGINGGAGAIIEFFESASGGVASFDIQGNAKLSINNLTADGVTIGSLEGEGTVLLGTKELTVGSSNRSTTFAGLIQDSGSLVKIGNGKLVLSNASTYTGGTTIQSGVLFANNRTGSATGTGFVQVNAGTLGGRGIITGPVTIGSGSGPGASLSPAGTAVGVLRIQSALTFNADATYVARVDSDNGRTDKVTASGVTIDGAALISLTDLGTDVVAPGTTFTLINNTSATPIAGSFANLPDGSVVALGNATYQAIYEGGTGNDLVLIAL